MLKHDVAVPRPRSQDLGRGAAEHRAAPTPLVFVACGTPLLCEAWGDAIRHRYTVDVATDRRSLEQSLTSRSPVAGLLDLDLPSLSGMDGLAAIRVLRPATKIIALTSCPDDREGLASLQAGARGYCHRDIEPSLLVKALDVVQRGELWIGRKLFPQLVDQLADLTRAQHARPAPMDRRLDHLTCREREIAQLVSLGACNKEIAQRFNVRPRTVKAHLTAIFKKLGVPGRLALALFVLEHSGACGPLGEGQTAQIQQRRHLRRPAR